MGRTRPPYPPEFRQEADHRVTREVAPCHGRTIERRANGEEEEAQRHARCVVTTLWVPGTRCGLCGSCWHDR
jgi:hypothetical protein